MKVKLVFTLLIFASIISSGQSVVGLDLQMIPAKYHPPVEGVNFEPSADLFNITWIVYSDRDHNTTFKKAGSNQSFKSAQFMEAFYVIDEAGHFVHIVKDPNVTGKKTSSQAIDYGWINKNNLLLWRRCMVTKSGGIERKAMVQNTLNTIKPKDIKNELDKKPFYNTPELTIKSEDESGIYEIFYIYKVTDEAILLGKKSYITVGDETDVIIGWMPRKYLTHWDHRVAIEPNWEPEAATERKSQGIKSTVFMDRPAVEKFVSRNFTTIRAKDSLWAGDSYDVRKIGEWRRFPVLNNENLDYDYYYVGVMGDLYSSSGSMDEVQKAYMDRDYSIMRQKLRNINIVFVIDGTTSMGPYFNSVSKAIKESMQTINNNNVDNQNNIRFGAVVYRDTDEGSRKTEQYELTNRYNAIATWLDNINARDIKDLSSEEAVYYGIKKALMTMGMDKQETNVIILIGDAGNHHRNDATYVDERQLTQLLSDYYINFLAFQVHNEVDKPTYNEFQDQMKRVVFGYAKNNYDQNIAQSDNKALRKLYNDLYGEPQLVAKNANEYYITNVPTAGLMTFCPPGQTITERVLSKKIVEMIDSTNAYTNRFLNAFDDAIHSGEGIAPQDFRTGKSANADAFINAGIIARMMALGWDESEIEFVIDENIQLFTEGWAAIKVQGLNHPLFQRVLFLSVQDLGKLVNDFESLSMVGREDEQRQKLVDAWIEILKKYIGKVDEEVLLQLSLTEINERVFGLPGTSGLLSDVKLNDIKDERIVSNSELERYITRVEQKYMKLMSIYNEERHPYSFVCRDVKYYWIPESLLP